VKCPKKAAVSFSVSAAWARARHPMAKSKFFKIYQNDIYLLTNNRKGEFKLHSNKKISGNFFHL